MGKVIDARQIFKDKQVFDNAEEEFDLGEVEVINIANMDIEELLLHREVLEEYGYMQDAIDMIDTRIKELEKS